MTIKEFKDQIKAGKVKGDAELVLHLESGDYAVSQLQYDPKEKKLRVCSADETRKQSFRVSYRITKDHKTAAFDTKRVSANDEDDIILDIEEWEARFLKEAGIEGEVSEKTGSTIVPEKEPVPVVKDGKLDWEETERDHYWNCQILEVFKEIDPDNDIYVRVWKNGNIG